MMHLLFGVRRLVAALLGIDLSMPNPVTSVSVPLSNSFSENSSHSVLSNRNDSYKDKVLTGMNGDIDKSMSGKAATSRRTPNHDISFTISFLLILQCCFFLLTISLPTSLFAAKRIDVEGMKQLEIFGKNLAKKYNLIYLNKGVGSIVDSNKTAWDISLMGYQQLNLDQARSFIVPIISDFWQRVTTDPLFDAYLKNAHAVTPWYSPHMTSDRIGIKVALWDANIDRYPAPYISQIRVCDGVIHFYQASQKDQSLQEPPHTETFEQAFALVQQTSSAK